MEKGIISKFSDESDGLLVLAILRAALIMETQDNAATVEIRTIGAGFEALISETAQFYFASRAADIPFSGFVSQLASFALASRTEAMHVLQYAPQHPMCHTDIWILNVIISLTS